MPAPSNIPLRDVTPKRRHPSPPAEVEKEGWAPQLTEMWVTFPGTFHPVFGWLREGAGPWLDTFFGSDGMFKNMTKEEIELYQLSSIASPEKARPPGGVILHQALYSQIRKALKARDYLRDVRTSLAYPIVTKRDWRRVSFPGSSLSLDYHFSSTECGIARIVRRTEASVVDGLPESYQFHCRDVGVECAVTLHIPCVFGPGINPLPLEPHSSPAPLPCVKEQPPTTPTSSPYAMFENA